MSTELIERFSKQFEDHCAVRHKKGAVEYGPLAFLENDTLRMLLEEMVDASNYGRYTYIKIMLLIYELQDQGMDIGAGAFKGVGEEWKDLQYGVSPDTSEGLH